MLRLFVILLLSIFPLWGSGALTFDGTTDFINCGAVVDFDGTGTWATAIAWVTPNFADTETNDHYIMDSYTGTPPTANGFSLYWRGSDSRFVMRLAHPDVFDIGVSCAPGVFPNYTFAAGDLVGMYFSVSAVSQQCTVFTPLNDRSTSNSSFNGLTYRTATANLIIGANDTATADFWDGDLHQIVMTNSALFNANRRHMPTINKFFFYPNWSVSTAEQAGETFVDYVAGWNFQAGTLGNTLASGVNIVDITNNGNDCPTGAGTGIVGAGTPMLK